jgi:BlaI family transcriptional regulator, penicillinase repressor
MSMVKKKLASSIGRAEMEVFRYVADHHPISIAKVADHFSETKGLARTTILNVMERLRKKGFLIRKDIGKIYHYSPKQATSDLLRNLVSDFVDRFLGGSVSPFVAYLADKPRLSQEEVRELKKIVRQMEDKEP